MRSSTSQMALNRYWIREVDRRAISEFGMSGLVLMENAARGVVDHLQHLGCHGPVVIACGKGNNGGDGLAIARWLDLCDVRVRVLLFADPHQLTGDALANLQIAEHAKLPIWIAPVETNARTIAQACGRPEWIVDALLGTGFQGETHPPLSTAIETLNNIACRKLAVDIPSGLDCDTGRASVATFRADHTVTFVAPKPGLLTPTAREYVGELHVTQIGAPRCLLDAIMQEAANRVQSGEN